MTLASVMKPRYDRHQLAGQGLDKSVAINKLGRWTVNDIRRRVSDSRQRRTDNDATDSPSERWMPTADCDIRVRRSGGCLVVEEQIGLVSVGVVLNMGWGRLDLNVAGRLTDRSRAAAVAGLLIGCESRW